MIDPHKLMVANVLKLPLIPFNLRMHLQLKFYTQGPLGSCAIYMGELKIGDQRVSEIFYFPENDLKDCKEEELYVISKPGLVFPSCLGQLTQLKSLQLSHNDMIEFPQWIFRLVNLEMLQLSSNKIKTIPSEIGGMSKLLRINLADNVLETLRVQIGELVGLQSLRLNKNQLRALPDSLSLLTNLSLLSIFDNPCNQPDVLAKTWF